MSKQFTLKDYINFVLKYNKEMPSTEQDILRISDLHSWYKYLSGFNKAYPY